MMSSRSSGCSSKTKMRVLTGLFPIGDKCARYVIAVFAILTLVMSSLEFPLARYGMQDTKVWCESRASRIANHAELLQEQIHAVEIDDGMTDVQRIHPQNAAGLCAALSQRGMGQRDDAKLLARHHKIANLQITDARGTDMLGCASGKIS